MLRALLCPSIAALLLVSASASAKTPCAQVEWGQSWWSVEVLKSKGKSKLIRYVGWGSEWDEWVGPKRLRWVCDPQDPPPPVEVLWRGNWFPGLVLERAKGKLLIHYIGFSSASDEWVTLERVRKPVVRKLGKLKKGSPVDILWGGTWYPGNVLEVRKGRYKVHYSGYGAEWDEWVGTDRLRAPSPGQPPLKDA